MGIAITISPEREQRLLCEFETIATSGYLETLFLSDGTTPRQYLESCLAQGIPVANEYLARQALRYYTSCFEGIHFLTEPTGRFLFVLSGDTLVHVAPYHLTRDITQEEFKWRAINNKNAFVEIVKELAWQIDEEDWKAFIRLFPNAIASVFVGETERAAAQFRRELDRMKEASSFTHKMNRLAGKVGMLQKEVAALAKEKHDATS